MLNEMQARMEKMEIKYETQMAEMAMENDTQAKIIHELRTKLHTAKDHEETEKVDTKNTKPKGQVDDDEGGHLEDEEEYDMYNDEDDEEEGFLKDDDNATAQWMEDNPVYTLDGWISSSFPPPALKGKIKDKWLVNIGSLSTHVRDCFSDEFDALSTALETAMDVTGSVTTLVKQVSAHLGGAAFLTPVLLSRAVLAAKDTSPFAAKAADAVNQTWRAYMKSIPADIKQLRAQIKANEVPERLTEPDPDIPTPMAHRLNPAEYKRFDQAYETVLVLIKEALNAAARANNTPRALRQAWIDSFPDKCDDVAYIISQQRLAYESLVNALDEDVPDRERIARLRACFSARLLRKHSDLLADAGHDADTMKWQACLNLAKKAANYLTRRKTYDDDDDTPQAVTMPATTTHLKHLKHPRSDSDWCSQHKSDLISYGVCSLFMNQGSCDRSNCNFLHQLPETIDLDSSKWKDACERSAAYRAKKRAERVASAAPATLALPAPPPPQPPAELDDDAPAELSMPPPPTAAMARAAIMSSAQVAEEGWRANVWLGQRMMEIDRECEAWSSLELPALDMNFHSEFYGYPTDPDLRQAALADSAYDPAEALQQRHNAVYAQRAVAAPVIYDENDDVLAPDWDDDLPPVLRRK